MNDDTVTDELLREFLLGKVTDDVRERIEGQFVTDPQMRERVLAVEQDLIEDYLEGTLSADDAERFVARYAQTAEQRRKLRITKSIKDWAMAEVKAAPAVVVSAKPIWFRWAFVVPFAAIILFVIVLAPFWLNKRAEHSAIVRELAQLNAPSNATAADVQRELAPVTVRSAEPQTQLSPPAKGVVELRLLLIREERYSNYTATIHRVGGSETYAIQNLQASSDGKAIRLFLPAHVLTRGLWQISLTPDTGEYQLNIGD
jgi:hypothetical protein